MTLLFRCFRRAALGGFCFGRRFTGPAGRTCDFWNIDDRGLHRRSLAVDLSRFGWRCFDGCCDHDRDRCGFRVLRGTLFLLSRNLCWRDVRYRTLISCPVIARTITPGAFVAGLRAGKIFNEFPLMGGQVVPPGYLSISGWWRNALENPVAAQFHHRVLAIVATLVALTLVWRVVRAPVTAMVFPERDMAGSLGQTQGVRR